MKNNYTVNGDLASIELNYKGQIFHSYIDKNDLPKLLKSNYRWCLKKDGNTHYCFAHYKTPEGKNTTITLHRFLLEPSSSAEQIDHINHNGLDNRRCNLRAVDSIQNAYNRLVQSNNTSGTPGVAWSKQKKKWRAELIYSQTRVFEKYYDDIEQAKRDLELIREAVTKVVFLKNANENIS